MNDYVVEASTYRNLAVVFWENAKFLEKAFAEKGQTVPRNYLSIPFYFIVSHSIELLLKSALLKRGVSPSELKRLDHRHNLATLLQKVEDNDVPISKLTKRIVNALSDQHKSHALRYMVFLDDGVPTFTPEPDDIYTALDELLMATALKRTEQKRKL